MRRCVLINLPLPLNLLLQSWDLRLSGSGRGQLLVRWTSKSLVPDIACLIRLGPLERRHLI